MGWTVLWNATARPLISPGYTKLRVSVHTVVQIGGLEKMDDAIQVNSTTVYTN